MNLAATEGHRGSPRTAISARSGTPAVTLAPPTPGTDGSRLHRARGLHVARDDVDRALQSSVGPNSCLDVELADDLAVAQRHSSSEG